MKEFIINYVSALISDLGIKMYESRIRSTHCIHYTYIYDDANPKCLCPELFPAALISFRSVKRIRTCSGHIEAATAALLPYIVSHREHCFEKEAVAHTHRRTRETTVK